ncbi:MAG TPA: response regulator [Vicinamibacterales bacterium]|nr:response regulator [Vicinamibacterales bacterium]
MSASSTSSTSPTASAACPYCGRVLLWMPSRWLGRGVFQCEQCGDFPDFRTNGSVRADPAPSTRCRVLIVDDSDEHRELYATMLGEAMSVITAADGEQGVALAKAQSPDVILLDVMMPVMDGWRVCELLKSEPATAPIPIVMPTSLDAEDVPARAQQAGAVGVLMKPCPIERLTLTIESAVRQM